MHAHVIHNCYIETTYTYVSKYNMQACVYRDRGETEWERERFRERVSVRVRPTWSRIGPSGERSRTPGEACPSSCIH